LRTLSLAHEETIGILNLHATVRANTKKNGNPEFYAKFAQFVQAYKCSGHTVDYLLDAPTTNPTRAAYEAFLRCPHYEDPT